ncbi:type IV toxin-antitoxin system AbiEi family antitoxin [Mycolicibacter kumamotonensis]|uniref:type IV toxin-antitoxin system AbiEi family antitoxin n=1 Tax=Mycolicibacter kumamotonensis TaxID=354243 RepID=UPI000A068EAD|nr:type IV toxin-antitoxin system AbiEi family antitoxin [Mycolicibacter kumamotonensis]
MDFIPGSLAEAAERHLANYGVEMHGDLSKLTWLRPQPLALDIDGRHFDVGVLYLPRMSATEALRAAHAVPADVPLLVIGPRIHESSAETFRARGIWYLDEVGNAYLHHPGLVVDVRGRRGSIATQDRHVTDGPTNPFTPKRAQVVLVLLSDPALVDAPFREIADRAGVSVGMAKGTIDTLQAIGFVEKIGAHRRLVRGSELLDLWGSTYAAGLGRSNNLLTARGDVDKWSLPDGIDFAISGEQAVPNYIRHAETLVLYVRSDGDRRPLNDLVLQNRWHRDPKGNIILRELFWRDLPGLSSHTAPPLLIYADLLAAREPRQTQVAHEMRRDLEKTGLNVITTSSRKSNQ